MDQITPAIDFQHELGDLFDVTGKVAYLPGLELRDRPNALRGWWHHRQSVIIVAPSRGCAPDK